MPIRASRPNRCKRITLLPAALLAGVVLLVCGACSTAWAEAEYRVQFRIGIRAGEAGVATGRIRIVQPEAHLRRLELNMPEPVFSRISADGPVERRGDVLVWQVPARGGEIRYRVAIDHRRNARGYDALLTEKWGVFRAEDVFPAAKAAFRPGARGRSELAFDLPSGWSVFTPYLPDAAGRLKVERGNRSFARPVGWLLLGAVGSRKDEIGTMTVRVAGPANQGVPRVPTLALMRWALPVLQGEFPDTPAYLLVVLADDPMWRGGLSAPNSLYQHARRPLISENGTSTLIHELVHVLAPLPTAVDHDWIDEGVAEYVGLVTLLRSDTISQERFAHAIDTFRRRGASVRTLRTGNAKGAITARAVAILHDVDEELQARSGKQTDIFDLVRALTEETGPIDLARLREIAAQLGGGKPLRALAHVPDARG